MQKRTTRYINQSIRLGFYVKKTDYCCSGTHLPVAAVVRGTAARAYSRTASARSRKRVSARWSAPTLASTTAWIRARHRRRQNTTGRDCDRRLSRHSRGCSAPAGHQKLDFNSPFARPHSGPTCDTDASGSTAHALPAQLFPVSEVCSSVLHHCQLHRHAAGHYEISGT